MSNSPCYALRNRRVWVAGHRGLVGNALLRRLERENCEVVVAPRESVDLRRPDQVERWMADVRPQAVFVAAARVGGIYANDTRPAEFIHDNLAIQTNVVEAARRNNVEKMLMRGVGRVRVDGRGELTVQDMLLATTTPQGGPT